MTRPWLGAKIPPYLPRCLKEQYLELKLGWPLPQSLDHSLSRSLLRLQTSPADLLAANCPTMISIFRRQLQKLKAKYEDWNSRLSKPLACLWVSAILFVGGSLRSVCIGSVGRCAASTIYLAHGDDAYPLAWP